MPSASLPAARIPRVCKINQFCFCFNANLYLFLIVKQFVKTTVAELNKYIIHAIFLPACSTSLSIGYV